MRFAPSSSKHSATVRRWMNGSRCCSSIRWLSPPPIVTWISAPWDEPPWRCSPRARECRSPPRSKPGSSRVCSRCRRIPKCQPPWNACGAGGFRMVTLTNSSAAAVAAQMQNSGLGKYFEESISVDTRPPLQTGPAGLPQHSFPPRCRPRRIDAGRCARLGRNGRPESGLARGIRCPAGKSVVPSRASARDRGA